MTPNILALDIAGNPFCWVTPQDAAHYYATGKVAWELGEREFLLRGGVSNAGVMSTMVIKPIIAIAGSEMMAANLRLEYKLGADDNSLLFARDRFICGFCGSKFSRKDLTRDHILARANGGVDTWTNCITACKKCNQDKGHKYVQDFRPLLFVPYVPCRNEFFLLSGRNVLADQHEYLAAKLPKHSRMLS